jgi:hypothetical protein
MRIIFTKKFAITLACLSIFLVLLTIIGGACGQPAPDSQEGSRQIALEYVRLETTFRFDGIPETLKATSTTSVGNGWQFTIEFDSRHAGYGNRSGQMLAQVITHHTAEITVQAGLGVTRAVMDGVWNMIDQRMIKDVEISPAPIHEVEVYFMESFPVQVGVRIKGGLRDGCTTFHDIEVTREGNNVNIEVTVQHPTGVHCPAVYTYFEENINLGSDFSVGETYTLNVNDYSTTFEYY